MEVTDDRLWKKTGWQARILKNADDDGWAVEMTRIGDSEATLVSPWTMGRDKKNPKPIDQGAFTQLIKTAGEILLRHEQQARGQLHKQLLYQSDAGVSMRADLDVVPDEDDPHAILVIRYDTTAEIVRSGRVPMSYKLNAAKLHRFAATGDVA
jgi:hypothetical protein